MIQTEVRKIVGAPMLPEYEQQHRLAFSVNVDVPDRLVSPGDALTICEGVGLAFRESYLPDFLRRKAADPTRPLVFEVMFTGIGKGQEAIEQLIQSGCQRAVEASGLDIKLILTFDTVSTLTLSREGMPAVSRSNQ